MSWAAHEFENYFIQKHVGVKASFLGIVVGTQLPDLFTKSFVYASDDPAAFHRGWPGVGFTQSLIFGFAFAGNEPHPRGRRLPRGTGDAGIYGEGE